MPAAVFAGEVQRLLADLIRIPSVNPSLGPTAASDAGEEAVAVFARDWLAAHGLRSRLEEAVPGRPNVVAEIGAGHSPTLILCGHLDTVATAGMTMPPFEPRVENGRMYGRGSYDMKGGVAAAMA